MKNDSPFYPLPTMDDKFFDKNKDGKLTGTETAFRDAHQMEMNDKVDAEIKNTPPSRSRGGIGGISLTSIVLLVFFILWLIDMLNR